MSKLNYLDIHNKILESGRLPGRGICGSMWRLTDQFNQFNHDFTSTFEDNNPIRGYWGYDNSRLTYFEGSILPGPNNRHADDHVRYDYTPLRQNLILLLAAINDQL